MPELTASTTQKLAYAMLEQAVCDVKALTKTGRIVNGRVIQSWPRRPGGRYPVCYQNHYNNPRQVEELLAWFHDGWARLLLDALGAKVDYEAMMERLGLERNGARI